MLLSLLRFGLSDSSKIVSSWYVILEWYMIIVCFFPGVVFQHNISDVLGSNKVYNTPVEGSPTDKYSYLGKFH